jgi:acyl-coenzyme A synthetase/AMP-(fatty) acid ligase
MMHRGWESIGPSDRVFHAGALNWTFTLGTGLLDPWTLGATALIPGPGLLPSVFPLLLRRHDATIFAGAPGAIRQMLRAPVPALPRLRHGLSAGETLLPSLRAEWRTATGTDLHEALGMSECSTYISGSPERPAPDGFAGYAQPSRRIALLDGETGLAGADQGEIAIHRDDPGLMLGYLEEPKATAARYRGDWFLTGDIASQGPDGAFRYLGRADDLMNAGGYRVSPAEVEAALSGVPGVDDLAVLSREVRPGVGVIACVYVADADRSAELAERAGLVLARYKQPREFRRTNALPRNPNGKLNRGKLHQLWDVKA